VDTARSSETFFLSVITIGEVRKGLAKLSESKKKEKLTVWLDTLLEEYQDRILAIDLMVAEQWGLLQGHAEKQGVPMASIDGLIAATTCTHNLTLVTRNESDFPSSQIAMVNPWKV